MAKVVLTYSSFNKVTKTVTFSTSTFDIKNLYAIIDTTANVLLYAPTVANHGYVSFTSNTIVLEFDTNISTIFNTDEVMIIYEQSLSSEASSANQVIANSFLSSINTKIPPLGQALAGSSVPVVLTAAQIALLTPPPQ